MHAFIEKIMETKLRRFPWRGRLSPYKTLVSEYMLQQTQTKRVANYFDRFIDIFSTVEKLAGAARSDLLHAWSGLGYNSRALYLKQSANQIISKYHGEIPDNYDSLLSLAGIGPYTANAILIFGFNQWHVCLETNIRTVLYYYFFSKEIKLLDTSKSNHVKAVKIDDAELLTLLSSINKVAKEKNISAVRWYSLLMDHGASLKARGVKLNHMNANYKRQSSFSGSFRQVRSTIIKQLLSKDVTISQMKKAQMKKTVCGLLGCPATRVEEALQKLSKEKMIAIKKGYIRL